MMTKNILDPNVNAFPYWGPLGIQVPVKIPGSQIAGEVQDIRINRIPSETDYNNSDIRRIPFPTAPGQDASGAAALFVHPVQQGRGAGVGLLEMLQTSMTTPPPGTEVKK